MISARQWTPRRLSFLTHSVTLSVNDSNYDYDYEN